MGGKPWNLNNFVSSASSILSIKIEIETNQLGAWIIFIFESETHVKFEIVFFTIWLKH